MQNEVRSNLEYYERLMIGAEKRIADLQQQLREEESVLEYIEKEIERLRSNPEDIINYFE